MVKIQLEVRLQVSVPKEVARWDTNLQVAIPKEALRVEGESPDQLMKRLEHSIRETLRETAVVVGSAVRQTMKASPSEPLEAEISSEATVATVMND